MIVISHSISETAAAGRVIVIDSPQQFQDGTVDQLLQELGASNILNRVMIVHVDTIDEAKEEIQTIVTGSELDPRHHSLPETSNRFKREVSPSDDDDDDDPNIVITPDSSSEEE
jgi:ABC-type multidrug transport system ATPase subunit